MRDVPVDVDCFDLLPQLLEHIPILGFGYIGRLTEVPVQLIKLVQLHLVGSVHGRGGIEAETARVLIAQSEEVRRSPQGIVDSMQGCTRYGGQGRDLERGPMAILATSSDGANLISVDGISSTNNSMSQTSHNGLFDIEKGHYVQKLLDFAFVDVLLDLDVSCDL